MISAGTVRSWQARAASHAEENRLKEMPVLSTCHVSCTTSLGLYVLIPLILTINLLEILLLFHFTNERGSGKLRNLSKVTLLVSDKTR